MVRVGGSARPEEILAVPQHRPVPALKPMEFCLAFQTDSKENTVLTRIDFDAPCLNTAVLSKHVPQQVANRILPVTLTVSPAQNSHTFHVNINVLGVGAPTESVNAALVLVR